MRTVYVEMLRRVEKICTPTLYFNTNQPYWNNLANFPKHYPFEQSLQNSKIKFPIYILMKLLILNDSPGPIIKLMQIVHELSNGLHDMKREYTDELSILFADTFLEMNRIWASANLDREVLNAFFVQEIHNHLDSEARVRARFNDPLIRMNQVLVFNKRIVGATLHMELDEYKQSVKSSKESEIPLFRELEREGKELIKAVDLQTFESGKYVYASWGAQYRISEMKAHNKLHNIAMIYGQMHERGFKGMIFRSSNEKVIQFHTFLGGQILKEVPFIIKEQEFKLFFMQEEFDNPNLQKAVAEAKAANSAVPQQSSL